MAVEEKLALNWSPQQIARSLRETHAGNPDMTVSHETIYRTLFIQARGGLKGEARSAVSGISTAARRPSRVT